MTENTLYNKTFKDFIEYHLDFDNNDFSIINKLFNEEEDNIVPFRGLSIYESGSNDYNSDEPYTLTLDVTDTDVLTGDLKDWAYSDDGQDYFSDFLESLDLEEEVGNNLWGKHIEKANAYINSLNK